MFDERQRHTRPPRRHVRSFHLDDAESWQLKRAAKAAGLSISELIRRAVGREIDRDRPGATR